MDRVLTAVVLGLVAVSVIALGVLTVAEAGQQHRPGGNVDPVYEVRRSPPRRSWRSSSPLVVEEATGRKVIAYMSQIHQSPDLAVEILVLEPLGDPVAVDRAEALPEVR